MLSVPEALARLLALVAPMGTETVGLAEAGGRVLAADAVAARDQPPFAASAMDGWAVRAADARPGARLRVIGEAPAGRAFAGRLGPGEAVRLFTGAPMPEGADAVLIQEDGDAEGAVVTVREGAGAGAHVRPRGLDFRAGARLKAPRRLSPGDVALLAAMNVPEVAVARRPRVALIPTGDELVEPGERPGDDQIVASNHYGLAALLAAKGAEPWLRPIVPDTAAALTAALAEAAAGADLVVTLGGASVGDYDLVKGALGAEGLAFYKVAMRPGKPLIGGRIAGRPMVGLPGNPVSALVSGWVFLVPVIARMLGLPGDPPTRRRARLAAPLGAGGPREHYMRARLAPGEDLPLVTAFGEQDSSMLSFLSEADALLVQPAHAPPAQAGTVVEVVVLRENG
jgi:molybdopterin molybdotransferase